MRGPNKEWALKAPTLGGSGDEIEKIPWEE